MARRHHRISDIDDFGFMGVIPSGGDSDKCAFYFYNNDNSLTQDLSLYKEGSPTNISLEYSANGVNWTPYTIGTNISMPPGSYIYIRNTSDTYTGFSISSSAFYIFGVTSNGGSNVGGKNMVIGGNIKSLLCRNWGATINLSDFCFYRLFSNYVVRSDAAPVQWVYGSNDFNHIDFVLPFDVLYPSCYGYMFAYNNYTSMSGTVIERSTIEQRSSYNGVLRLTGDMTNATSCFVNMFANTGFFIRGSLSKPALWIDMSGITGTMPESAFREMFYACGNLYSTTQVMQDLDWSFGGNGSIARYGFAGTFINCTILEENPFMREIRYKNNIITPGPYYSDAFDDMFMEIYESKASIGEFGFDSMFSGCSALRQGFLPPHAKLIGDNSVSGANMDSMYSWCANMKWLQYFHGNPILPAGYNYVSGGYWRDNPLTYMCYSRMFYGCSELLEAPILPADSDHMANYCYEQMFYNAQKISYVKMLGISNSTYTNNWLTGAAPVGTIVKAAASDGTDLWSGAPSGWSSFNTRTEPFWIKCLCDDDNTLTMSLNKRESPGDLSLKYRKDSESSWTSITASATRNIFQINPGERIFLSYSGSGSQNWSMRSGSTHNIWSFSSSAAYSNIPIYYSVGGVLYTLQWPDGLANSSGAIPTSFGNFSYLFNGTGSSGDSHLMYAQELDINSRLSLTGGNIDQGHNTVFQYSFSYCTNLIYPPAHTGGTIHTRTSSESAVSYTYTFARMFEGDTKLRESPILGTRTVNGNRRPYYYLFYNCSSLKKIFSNQSTAWNDGSSNNSWVYGVGTGGTLYAAEDAGTPSVGVSGIPSGWTLKKEIFSNNIITQHNTNLIYYLIERKNGSYS